MRNFVFTVAVLLNIFVLASFGYPTDLEDVEQDVKRFGARSGWKTLNGKPTLLIGHRGDPVLLPAHTLPGYEIAAIDGADYVEPDLFLTKDDVLVCFHELFLKRDTDVESHPEFEYLRRNFTSVASEAEGVESSSNDWVIKDFTWKQLKTLRTKQLNVGIRPQYFNYLFRIPSFQQYLNVIHKMTVKLKRKIGVIPELKIPAFNNEGKAPNHMEDIFLKVLESNGYATKNRPVEKCTTLVNETFTRIIACPHLVVQSFHPDTLKYLRTKLTDDLMQLLGIQINYYTNTGLKEISKYASWIGFSTLVYSPNLPPAVVSEIEPLTLIGKSHKLGMKVAISTIKDSREYPAFYKCTVNGHSVCQSGTKQDEMNHFFEQGVDGLFVENMAESYLIRARYEKKILRAD